MLVFAFPQRQNRQTAEAIRYVVRRKIAPSKPEPEGHRLLGLQRAVGNQAVLRLLNKGRPEASPSVERLSATPRLQRDAEAKDVSQPRAMTVDSFDFMRTMGVIAFDASPGPGHSLAPILKDLSKNSNVQLTVPPGSSGTITLDTLYLARLNVPGIPVPIPKGLELSAIARFRVSPDGKFEFTDKAPQISRPAAGYEPYTASANGLLNVGGDGTSGSMSLQLDLVASTTQTTGSSHTRTANEGRETTGDANLDLGIGGYKGGHKDLTGNSDAKSGSSTTTTAGATSASRGWSITLVVPPIPKVPPRVGPTLTSDVLFGRDSFIPKPDQKTKLQKWYLELPLEAREGLQSGKYKISLVGQASTTGDAAYNIKLTHQRNQEVTKLLKDIQPGLKFGEESFTNEGFLMTPGPANTESDEARAVHIKIEPSSK